MNKVVILHHSNQIGGGTLSCFDLVRVFREENYEITLIIPKGDKSYATKRAVKENIAVEEVVIPFLNFYLYNGSPNVLKSLFLLFKSFFYVNKWLKLFRQRDESVYILNSIVQLPYVILLKILKKKVICYVRETKSHSTLNFVLKYFLNKCDHVIFLSYYDKKQWGLELDKSTVIPDFINDTYLLNNMNNIVEFDKSKFYVLYTGGFNIIKGVDTLLKSILNIKQSNLSVIICDCKPDRLINNRKFYHFRRNLFLNKCSKEVCRIKNKGNVELLFVGKKVNTMSTLYANCDLVVVPYKIAHQSRDIYEAGYFRKPVLVAKFKCFAESIFNNCNGLFFIPNNPDDLNNKLSEFLNMDKKTVEYLGSNNFSIATNIHGYSKSKKLLVEIVTKINNC